MKKSLANRRVPRKIGQDEDGDEPNPTLAQPFQEATEPVVRRPLAKARKPTTLRKPLRPSSLDDDDDDDDDGPETSVVAPKRSTLARGAMERNATARTSLLAAQLPVRTSDDEDRPSYSQTSLQELRDSTPSAPRKVQNVEDATPSRNLDIAAKFGDSALASFEAPGASAIPSAAEIAEKKARRARLALEQQAEEYISLDPDDPDLDDDENVMRDEAGRLVLKPKDKYGLSNSRLVRDDEDIMENFEDFTEDGKISLGPRAEAEATKRRKQEMARQIAQAENASDSDSDNSERERNEAFEAAQTKHGTFTQNGNPTNFRAHERPSTPPIITPLPTLDGALERLRKQLSEMQTSRSKKLQEMEALRREKVRLAEEEVRIQRALKETAEKFEALRKEKSLHTSDKAPPETALSLQETDQEPQEIEDEDDEYPDEDAGAPMGLGFGSTRRGIGASR